MPLLVATLLALAPANANQALLAQLHGYDERVGTIGYRLARDGVALCPDTTTPSAGLQVHLLGQYGKAVRGDARTLFGLGDYPAILAVAPDGAASRAGLKVGDWIVSIDGADQAARSGSASAADVTNALDAALAHPPADLVIARKGVSLALPLAGLPACATRVELVPGRKLNAAADGRIVQLTTAILEQTQDDNELAFVIAHEMAHNILKHRERLDRIGRSASNVRDTEIEADRFALKLMKAAGYDPAAAAGFWARFGRKTGAGIFSDGTHMRTKARVRLLREEANALAQ